MSSVLVSRVVSIPVCHAADWCSIPWQEEFYVLFFFHKLYFEIMIPSRLYAFHFFQFHLKKLQKNLEIIQDVLDFAALMLHTAFLQSLRTYWNVVRMALHTCSIWNILLLPHAWKVDLLLFFFSELHFVLPFYLNHQNQHMSIYFPCCFELTKSKVRSYDTSFPGVWSW